MTIEMQHQSPEIDEPDARELELAIGESFVSLKAVAAESEDPAVAALAENIPELYIKLHKKQTEQVEELETKVSGYRAALEDEIKIKTYRLDRQLEVGGGHELTEGAAPADPTGAREFVEKIGWGDERRPDGVAPQHEFDEFNPDGHKNHFDEFNPDRHK